MMHYPKEYRLAVDRLVRGITTERLQMILKRYETDTGVGIEYHARAVRRELENAARILTHYIRQALPDADPQDTAAEMRDVVTAIFDAAVLAARDERTNP